MEPNLFDRLDDLTRPAAEDPLWASRAPFAPQRGRDLLLIPLATDWANDEAAADVLTTITNSPMVAAAVSKERVVEVQLDDAWLREAGQRILAGADGRNADLAAGQRTAVYFWGANTTKALHVGHLRNLAVGHALSAALSEAGATVERRSLLSDIGRGMGEAMAGIMRSGKHTQVLHEIPGKSDHFVGACYASYIKSRAQAQDDAVEDSLDRESIMHDDSADVIVGGVLAGDPHVLELWSRTRAWVLAGHRKTLARLGIEFDRVIFESDFLDEMSELGTAGMKARALERRGDGVVIYRTGRSELEEMPLVRPDGLSTQHMRALAYWTVAPELEEMTSIQVCGGEWVSHVTCRQDLMARLSGQNVTEQHPTHTVFHGLVAEGGQRLSSSQEGASLIDELIEMLDTEIDRDPEKRAVRDQLAVPEALGAQVALGYFLLQQPSKSVDFDPAELLLDGRSLAWDIARARAHRPHPVGASTHEDPVGDPAYRFAIVQRELFRVHLSSSIGKLDVTPIARHASHLARWYVEQPRSPEVAAIVRVALDDVERSLGLSVGS